MPINQLNQDLNDTFEVCYPPSSGVRRFLFRAWGRLVSMGLSGRIRFFNGRALTNERIVEYPLIIHWLRSAGRALDIGCVSSRLPVQLASLGYEVHALDTRPYGYTHPNLTFHQNDLFSWEPRQPFDIVILVSVLEHFGLGDYGDIVMPDADRNAVERIYGWMSKGGQLLVSVPFGIPEVTIKHRIYSYEQLRSLFSKFHWENDRYFMRRDERWMPVEHAALANVRSPSVPPNGVAVLDLRKV